MIDSAHADSFAPHVPELIQAIVSFLWLTLAGVAFFRFYGSLRSAIDSRSLSIDIGGFKLSFPEAAEGLKKQVADLQTKLAELELSINQGRISTSDEARTPGDTRVSPADTALNPPEPGVPKRGSTTAPSEVVGASSQHLPSPKMNLPPRHAEAPPPPRDLALRVLWVDDHPKGNAYEIDAITSAGGTVEIARSTSEALAKFETGHFDAVITDMGRGLSREAGLDLIRAIRKVNGKTPVFVYTGSSQVSGNQIKVNEAGGNGITASSVDLFEMLRNSRSWLPPDTHRPA